MKRNPELDLQATAYHEAGHAVVAWWLGVGIRRATIIPDKSDNSRGHVLNHSLRPSTYEGIELADPFDTSRLRAEKRVMVSMAGEMAQRRFNPHSVRFYHASSDREYIIGVLERYAIWRDGIRDTRPHHKLLQGWTEMILSRLWYVVETVANALLERRTLSGKDLRAVMLKAKPKGNSAELMVPRRERETLSP